MSADGATIPLAMGEDGEKVEDRKGMLAENAKGEPIFDFSTPKGAPALLPPDSVSWRLYKNPFAGGIGAICAVLMEFADPRIRSGVWDHSTFKSNPNQRARRTGMAGLIGVYGPAEDARKLIAGVTRLHSRVKGRAPEGLDYFALDPELTNWVHATAVYGVLNAYAAYVAPLSRQERDQFYAEGEAAAKLFRAPNPPLCEVDFEQLFQKMRPGFSPSPIVFEYLEISSKNSLLPPPFHRLKKPMIKAAIDPLPGDLRKLLGLGPEYDLKGWERALLKFVARQADRKCIRSAPPAQACLRMGLPADYLYKKQKR